MKKLEVHTIWFWRKRRGLSETYLAHAVGVHLNTLRNWEKDPSVIPLAKANAMAKILEIKTEQIDDKHDYRDTDEMRSFKC